MAIIKKRKNIPILRTILFPGIALITLLIGTAAFPGFSFLSLAHAEATTGAQISSPLPTTCATDPTELHCNNQDPILQGCSKDAETLSYEEINDQHWKLLATIQRRYSPTCHSEWGRIIEATNQHHLLSITMAKNEGPTTAGPVAFSTMVFVPNLSIASPIVGTVRINGIPSPQEGNQEQAAFLPALPATQ